MKYKLIKPLPGYEVGQIIDESLTCKIGPGDRTTLTVIHMLSASEYFEPVIERWKPDIREAYFYVTASLRITDCRNDNVPLDKDIIDCGNCFKTPQQAIEAAKRVKEILMNYHKELNLKGESNE